MEDVKEKGIGSKKGNEGGWMMGGKREKRREE